MMHEIKNLESQQQQQQRKTEVHRFNMIHFEHSKKKKATEKIQHDIQQL